jgi:hypothetical protein
VTAPPIGVPEGREGAAETEERVLDRRKRQIVGVDLDREDDYFHVEEEVELDVFHGEIDRRRAPFEGDAGRRDIVALEDADGRFRRRSHSALRLAVEAALHVREKADELAVLPFAREIGTAGVAGHSPGAAQALQHLPWRRTTAFPHRHQLQRPEQNLVEASDLRNRSSSNVCHESDPEMNSICTAVARIGKGRGGIAD